VVALAQLLRSDGPVDLPLVMLLGLAERCQQHDPSISSTPVGDPRRNITQPDPQLPDWPFQVVRPWAAEFAALLGEHPAYLVDALEIAGAKTVQPVADFRFELEVVRAPCLVAHVWSGYLRVPTLSSGCHLNTPSD
jgi:hypothetical protein